MFQLDEAMGRWRAGLMEPGTLGPADLNELESHLGDDVDQLVDQHALSEEEAFVVAVHRLGSSPKLGREYGKINVGRIWARRLFWMLSGYVAVSFTMAALGAMGGWLGVGVTLAGLLETTASHLVFRSLLMGLALIGLCGLALLPSGREALIRTGERVMFFGRQHPVLLLGGAYMLMVALRMATVGRTVVMARLLGPERVGQAALAGAYFSVAVSLVFPAIILLLLGWTYRALHRPAASR